MDKWVGVGYGGGISVLGMRLASQRHTKKEITGASKAFSQALSTGDPQRIITTEERLSNRNSSIVVMITFIPPQPDSGSTEL